LLASSSVKLQSEHDTSQGTCSLISARLVVGGGGSGAVCAARRVHRFPRSRLGSASAAAVRFARHGAFTGFPDLGSARLRRQWCGLRGTARSQVSPISARLGSALAAAAAVAVGTARCSFIRPQRDHRAKYVSDKDGCDWSETYQYHAVSS